MTKLIKFNMLIMTIFYMLNGNMYKTVLELTVWTLMLECGRRVRRAPVLKHLPPSSTNIVRSVRTVEQTYSDTHCVQLNLYTREDCKEAASLSLFETRDVIL